MAGKGKLELKNPCALVECQSVNSISISSTFQTQNNLAYFSQYRLSKDMCASESMAKLI